MSDHKIITELERRITSALERIGAGLDAASPQAEAARPDPAVEKEIAELKAQNEALRAELESVNTTNAQLTERIKALREREGQGQGQSDGKVEKMTRQLDVQGLELQRMRKSTMQLREHLRVLHEAAAEGIAEPHLINKAMLAELESLRATRHTETAEMDEILAALQPLIKEAQ